MRGIKIITDRKHHKNKKNIIIIKHNKKNDIILYTKQQKTINYKYNKLIRNIIIRILF